MSSAVVNFFPIGFPAIHVVYAANFLPLVSSHRSRNFNQWLICLNTTKTLFLPFKIQTHANKSVQKSLFSFRLPAALVMTNSTSFYFGDWESLCFNINMYTQSSTQSISNSDKHWHFVQENPSKFRYAFYSLHELNFSIEILPMDLLNRECSYVRRNTTKNRYNKTEARKKEKWIDVAATTNSNFSDNANVLRFGFGCSEEWTPSITKHSRKIANVKQQQRQQQHQPRPKQKTIIFA